MNGSWLDRNRNVVFIILVLVTLGGAGVFYLRRPTPEPIEILPPEATTLVATPVPLPSSTPTLAPVRVYITGAVVRSDVYVLPAGSIIKHAIEAAGGFTPDADWERINQAQELRDQQQIHVPRLGEEHSLPPVQDGQRDSGGASQEAGGESGTDPAPGNLVNLNTATLEQLDALPGIGPALAQRIIDYRENIGGFTTIEEITQVSGIGEATFAELEGLITVE